MKIGLKLTQRNRLSILLMIASLICLSLLGIRTFITGQYHFYFLAWNLFLAWIPYLLATQLRQLNTKAVSNWKTGVLLFSWLIFFPNAPYILTDLFHLKQRLPVPIWFDLALIASCAWNGLMLGFISLMYVQDFLSKRFNLFISKVAVGVLLLLCGFGIYLGRYQRWNSWDLITNPGVLMNDVAERFLHPFQHPRTMGVTILFSVFLLINYTILTVLARPYNQPIEEA